MMRFLSTFALWAQMTGYVGTETVGGEIMSNGPRGEPVVVS